MFKESKQEKFSKVLVTSKEQYAKAPRDEDGKIICYSATEARDELNLGSARHPNKNVTRIEIVQHEEPLRKKVGQRKGESKIEFLKRFFSPNYSGAKEGTLY